MLLMVCRERALRALELHFLAWRRTHTSHLRGRFDGLHRQRRHLVALLNRARISRMTRRLDVLFDLFAMHDLHLLIEVALDAQQDVLFELQQLRDVLTVLLLQLLNRLVALRDQQRFQKRDGCHDQQPTKTLNSTTLVCCS